MSDAADRRDARRVVTDTRDRYPGGLPAHPCRTVLCGWYGAANLGDELILSAFVEWVRAAAGVPSVVSVHPEFTARTLGVDAVDYTDLAGVVQAFADADLVVLGGGGLFQDYDAFDVASLHRFPARNVSQFAQYAYLAEDLDMPFAALAQGVGPLRQPQARAIAADVFRHAASVSVRDRASAALLRSIGVAREAPVAPDPAWSLFDRIAPAKALASRYPALAGRRVLAMVLRHWPFDAAWESAFVESFAASVPQDWACLWLDFARLPGTDGRAAGSEIAARLTAKLPRVAHAIWDGMAVDEAASLIAASDACIAMRLHGALLAHLAGVPTAMLEYDDKVGALADELDMPAAQRVPLDAIASRLPAAVRHVTAKHPFRVARDRSAALARASLAHRDALHDAMVAALARASWAGDSTVRLAPARRSSLLAEWLGAEPAAAQRVAGSLRRRLSRAPCRPL